MPNGYTGKILRVNLTTSTITKEEMPDAFYRQYFGGEGFIAYFLLKEVPRGADPLGPENKLIFAAGPLTGVPVGGCGRHAVGAKSPLTGGFGEADSGGYWGAELKMAGFDAIIVEGKAEKPVYISIKDGEAEIKDAGRLWGMKTLECQDAIREELADTVTKVAQIGPSGENLVRFASISNDLDAFAGRSGLGAVMGSKKLKAIACRGHQRLTVADPEAVSAIGKWVRDNLPITNKGIRDLGTASGLGYQNKKGGLPTRNFQLGSFEGADKIGAQAMNDTIFTKRRGCFACPVQCKREVKVDEPYNVDPRYGGPEYETLAAFGSNCGVDDLKMVAKANEVAGAYCVDSISCGGAIAFAMECFERGILTTQDTDGLELRFGNGAAVVKMIEQISLRQGLGALLAEGVARASKKIGKGAEDLAMHVKGQEFPMHEPRWKPGMGMGFAVSPTGADHCHNMHDANYTAPNPLIDDMKALGVFSPLPVGDMSPAKLRLLKYATEYHTFFNCAVCCYFVMIYGQVTFDRIVQLIKAVTGWNTSVFELMKVAERATNLARVYNIREGLTNEDDTLPKRCFTPQTSGAIKGLDPETFRKARDTYYDMAGWPEGVPSIGKLGELGVEWAMPLMQPK